jgi:hypothetical protein
LEERRKKIMIKQIIKVKDRVRKLLRDYPQTRDCDTSLYFFYLWKYHDLKYVTLRDALKAPVFESISRARRLIQAKGDYVGNRKKARYEDAEEMRQNIKGV